MSLERLQNIVRRLRAPGGCPWDRRQDRDSIKSYVVEEAYEVVDAVESGDAQALMSELGDLLFQIVFHAELGRERGEFDLEDIANAVSDKMASRHPKIFGDGMLSDAEAKLSWEARKARERGSDGLFWGIPKALPALHKAQRLSDRAATLGFEWPSVEGAWSKLDEEVTELREAVQGGQRDAIVDELGDVLFCVVNLARWFEVSAEDALQRSNQKFIRRFGHVDAGLRARGLRPGEASLGEMDTLWDEAKRRERDGLARRPSDGEGADIADKRATGRVTNAPD